MCPVTTGLALGPLAFLKLCLQLAFKEDVSLWGVIMYAHKLSYVSSIIHTRLVTWITPH